MPTPSTHAEKREFFLLLNFKNESPKSLGCKVLRAAAGGSGSRKSLIVKHLRV